MSPQETLSKESPDPINVLISIMKPGGGRYFLIVLIIVLTAAHFICYSEAPSTPPLLPTICNLLPITCSIPPTVSVNIIRIFLSILTVIYIAINLCEAYKKKSDIINSFHKNQPQFFTIVVVFGGTLAILIPMIMNVTKLIGDGAPLTTALLGITGGIIAIFGYYKTHQKSELEKEQLEIQKQKDTRDHIRQLHDSYNDRFDKAVAELNGSDMKAAYAAVPKLAKLADAWLDYKDLSNNKKELKKLKKKAKKEAQTIINVLCKYIRTTPNNYTNEQLEKFDSLPESDKKVLVHEADIRRLIFSEMSDRSSKATFENKKLTIISGDWSEFDFDFRQAPIFYPLNNLTIEKGIFTSAKFYNNANFNKSTFFQKADFSKATFIQNANFNGATFIQNANFNGATFAQEAAFSRVTFTQEATFSGATFTHRAYFNDATFTQDVHFVGVVFPQDVYFLDTTFTQVADFTEATFTQNVYASRVTFVQKAYFVGATFIQETYFVEATFTQNASFNGATFTQYTSYNGATFTQEAFFFGATFAQNADFNGATFAQNADFNGATFTQKADFSVTHFAQNAEFKWATFTEEANFSDATFTEEANFSEATFAETAIFHETTFTRAANFSGAKFTKLEPSFVLKKRKAQFSAAANPQDYDFSAAPVGESINCGHATLLGEPFEIPLGTVLFDPMSPKYKDGNYSGLSEPAKPIEEPDNQGETPSK